MARQENENRGEQVDSLGGPKRKSRLSRWILVGLLAGIVCGVFFGDYCSPLKFVGDAFVGLLQMTVLPYIVVSLVVNLGRLSFRQSRRLALVGSLVLLGLWAIGLFHVIAMPQSFPVWKAGSFFSTAMIDDPAEFDLLGLFIPSNFFASLADNLVPAVVIFCICVGLALSGLENKQPLLASLELLGKALTRVNGFVVRLTPYGVFAIAANAAGTMTLAEAGRLQAYLIVYTCAVLIMTFVILPWLIAICTPFRYRDIIGVSKDALVMAFATGKLIVVLPLLIEQTEQLFERYRDDEATSVVDVLYPLAYPFPHLGKLLAMLFIPFSAWFLGNTMSLDEYPPFLAAGLLSHFGGPLLATPFLLDLMHLPRDMFQLFLVSGVYCGRISDALGVMHLVAFTLLTTCAFTGRLQIQLVPMLRYLLVTTLMGLGLIVGLRYGLGFSLQYVERKEDIVHQMQLLERPVESAVLPQATPNPEPLLPGETLVERIRRRGVIRVGYNEDKLPFAYFNDQGQLVGFDVNLAHGLARDLGVRIEFVRFDRKTLVQQLKDDHFDVVMSGLVGTLERAEAMQHTKPYLDVTLSLVVPDYRVRSFGSIEAIRQIEDLRIGFVDLSRGFTERLRNALPNAELVELPTNQAFFREAWHELDALLISAESGSAFTLLYPEFEVVVPDGPRVALPLFYAIGADDAEMRDFLEHWVTLRDKDGTLKEHYDHWILGISPAATKPRWSVIRDVLGWVE